MNISTTFSIQIFPTCQPKSTWNWPGQSYSNGVYVARARKLMTDRFWFWVRMVVGSMQYRKQGNINRHLLYIYIYIIAFYFVQHRNLDFQPNFHILQNASNYWNAQRETWTFNRPRRLGTPVKTSGLIVSKAFQNLLENAGIHGMNGMFVYVDGCF